MTQTSTTTIHNTIPTRISSTHYQMPSRTREDKMHNLKLQRNKQGRLVWLCDCEDATYNKNLDCDHRIYLIEWIQQEKAKQAPAPEKQHSSSVELVQVLTRIAILEAESTDLSKALYAQSELIDIKDQQIIILQEKLKSAEYQAKQHQERLDDQRELIAALQTSVCKLNERTINHDAQINALTEQIQKPEQVVKVIVEHQNVPASQPAKAREAAPQEMVVKTVEDQLGKVIACKVNKFNVKVLGNCAAGCDCSIGIMDKQCPHMVKVDQFLSK